MKFNDLCSFLEAEFGKVLKSDPREDRISYYWHEIQKGRASTRLLRITKDVTGKIVEIKLPRTSLASGKDVFVPLPASHAEVATFVRSELSQLLGGSK